MNRRLLWYHLIGSFSIITAAYGANNEPTCRNYVYRDYDNPSSQESYHLICETLALSYLNLTQVPPDKLLGLTIDCKQFFPGTLDPGQVSHLVHLRELRIHGCLVGTLPQGLLDGFPDLELLVVSDDVKTFAAISPTQRTVAPCLFSNVPKLQILNFASSALTAIPPDLLCPVPNLILLELAHNNLTNIEDIGCGPNNTCCPNLKSLNMTNNQLERITATGLKPMKNMMLLSLGFNRIEEIEPKSFDSMTSLLLVDLKFNKIQTLPGELFKANEKIIQINLNNNLINRLPEDLFRGLHDLETLFLGNNHLTIVPSSAFQDLPKLTTVDFSENRILKIPESFFLSMQNIQNMSWAYNKIPSLDATGMNHLSSMIHLNLSHNTLKDISPDYFVNFTNLKLLDMSENTIRSPPFFHTLPSLQLLNLADNGIDQFEHGLTLPATIVELNLGNNKLNNVSSRQLNISSVQYLLLSNCHLNSLSIVNGSCPSLTHLYADSNNITNLNKILQGMLKLKYLNVSRNAISGVMDFSLTIPVSLEEFDISHNLLTSLTLTARWGAQFSLKALHASFNKISYVESASFPTSLVEIDLSDNLIASLGPGTFSSMPSLSYANFNRNKFTIVSYSWFRFNKPPPPYKSVPTVDLGYNFLTCDCKNDWLKRTTQGNTWLPVIKKVTYCTVTHQRMKRYKFVLYFDKVKVDQFFCTADQFNAAECVPNCTCYFTTDHNIYQVDCGDFQGNWSFDELPNDTSHAFLDGVRTVPFRILQRRNPYNKMTALFINGSRVSHLPDNAFASLPNLVELHLEDNELTEIQPATLNGLHKLQALYLSRNMLKQLDFTIFVSTISLRTLALQSNKLPNLHNFNSTRSIRELALLDNPFECSCSYLPALQQWIMNSDIVLHDANDTYCSDNKTGTQTNLLSFNVTACVPSKTIEQRHPLDRTMMLLLIAFGCVLAVIVLAVGAFMYREEILVYLYARFGIRLFYNNKEVRADKTFDAFICYSFQDENFVASKLVPGLDQYRLCLHERNFPAGGFIIDSVIEAVQQSCRTILVMSPHFVKSEWCRFEFKTAHQQSLKDRCCRLIMVILEDVPDKDMEPELRLYLSTNTYLRWDHKNFWDKLRFALPDVGMPVAAQVT